MSHQPLTSVTPATSVVPENTQSSETVCDPLCDRRALAQTQEAFAARTPVAILVDEGNGRAAQVLDRFAAEADAETEIVRIAEPFLDSMTFMRRVISGLGFQTKDLSLTDLESIFRMFLSYQQTHSRRTVICFEEAQDQGAWVLDKMCQFVEFEEEHSLGLFVVLVGPQELIGSLTEPPLDALPDAKSAIITVAPLALRDTRELVRRCVEYDGQHDVAQIFDFRAISRIHKLSAGAAERIGSLCGECVDMLDKENEPVVTPGIVNRAAESLGIYEPQRSEDFSEPASPAKGSASGSPSSGQLIVRKDGRVVQTLMVDKESILIGRDHRCDICIASPVVSRQHALIVNSPAGVKLVDLGSTNGSVVNGERIERCALGDNEVIIVGDCRIEFVAADYGPIEFETHRDARSRLEPDDDDSVFISEEHEDRTRVMAVEASP